MMAFGLGACAKPGSSASRNQDQQAAQQFLAERGGTPGAGAGNAGGAPQIVDLTGTVERVDGDRIEVQTRDGTSKTVQLVPNGKIRNLVAITAADIKAGETMMAVGAQNGDVFQAQNVMIGGDTLQLQGPGGAPSGGAGSGPDQAPINEPIGGPAGGPAGADGQDVQVPEPVLGTVEQVAGDTITMKGPGGQSETVQLAANAQITRQVEVKLADLKPGTSIVAFGSTKGDMFQAISVQVDPVSR